MNGARVACCGYTAPSGLGGFLRSSWGFAPGYYISRLRRSDLKNERLMNGTTGNNYRRRGFTLLELIFVMVIIGMVLAMAATSLRGFFASRQVSDAAAQMVALTQYARGQAAAEGRTFRLNLDTQKKTYWLTAETPGQFASSVSNGAGSSVAASLLTGGTQAQDAPVPNDFGRVFSLPEGSTLSFKIPADSAGSPRSYIPFYPDGRTEVSDITLTGKQGDTMRISCRGPAEKFAIMTGGAK
jgi:type II secretion system protein H